jgi:hypothetical protein
MKTLLVPIVEAAIGRRRMDDSYITHSSSLQISWSNIGHITQTGDSTITSITGLSTYRQHGESFLIIIIPLVNLKLN